MKGFLLALCLLISRPAAADIDQEIAATIDLFYNLEFDKALAAMDKLEERYPGHPAVPFYRSVIHYQRYTNEIPHSTDTLKFFEKENAIALEKSEAWISSNPAVGEFYLGASYGYAARYLSAGKHFFKAIPKARKAAKHLKKAVKLAPEHYDAYLGLGMYNYFTARVPKAARPFIFLLGLKGNRELGIEQVKLAAEKGGAAKMEARSVLAAIYSSEKEAQWDKAEPLLVEQVARYPANAWNRFRLIDVLERMGRWGEAAELAESKEGWILKLPTYNHDSARQLGFYRAAESFLFMGETQKAGACLDELEKLELEGELKEWALLRRANWLDMSGKREEALKTYRDLKPRLGEAKHFFKKPFPNGAPVLMPFDDGLGLD